MNVPAWTKPGVFGVIFGAILMAIVGFNWWGWTTEGAAQEMAAEQSEAAVTTLIVNTFTEGCVSQAQAADPALLAEVAAETSSWTRENLIEEAGWATVPGQEEPNSALAEACLAELEGVLTSLAEQEDL